MCCECLGLCQPTRNRKPPALAAMHVELARMQARIMALGCEPTSELDMGQRNPKKSGSYLLLLLLLRGDKFRVI